MKLIVGLGNPGQEYEKTRHNVGFMMADQLSNKFEFEDFQENKNFNALVSTGQFNGEKTLIVKPLTYMNLSGEAVGKIVHFYKIPVEDCLVMYDDLDLPLGALRIRKTGGPGTHNGMKSLVQALGEGFPRIRVGIETRGVVSPKEQDTSSFVLSVFNPEEKKTLKNVFAKVLEAVEMALQDGIEKAMNRYNLNSP